jgi:putative ABC transport system permease protein
MIISVTITIFLFCTLRSVVVSLDEVIKSSNSSRVVTLSAVSLFVELPKSMWPKIERVEGVENATHMTWFGGVYIDPSHFFARFAIDPPTFREVYGDRAPPGGRDILLSEEEWERFSQQRQACIIGNDLAKQYGWTVGSRIPLVGTIYPGDYELTVAGIYRSDNPAIDQSSLWFHWDYVNEVSGRRNRVGLYVLLLESPDQAGNVSRRVDQLFANSSTRTRTLSERALNSEFMSMFGNVPLLMAGLLGAVLFACFMITLNTMMLLARQRFQETGVLKALGFPDLVVGSASMAESIAICLVGTALGAGLALVVFNTAFTEAALAYLRAFFPGFKVHDSTLREALGLGLLLGIGSGLAPALLLGRLRLLDAIRGVG